jgi:hypothetical protein
MTTITALIKPQVDDHRDRPAVSRRRRRIFVDSLRFEWTKLHTVRSTIWTLLAALIAMLGIATLV